MFYYKNRILYKISLVVVTLLGKRTLTFLIYNIVLHLICAGYIDQPLSRDENCLTVDVVLNELC